MKTILTIILLATVGCKPEPTAGKITGMTFHPDDRQIATSVSPDGEGGVTVFTYTTGEPDYWEIILVGYNVKQKPMQGRVRVSKQEFETYKIGERFPHAESK